MSLLTSRSHEPLVNKKKEKKARKPIRKVAKVRAKLNREYMKLRAEFLAANPYCQYSMAENGIDNTWRVAYNEDGVIVHVHPTGGWSIHVPPSTECHHRKGRGKFLLDTSTWLAVSSDGHRAIHADPKTSYEKGYMLPRR